MIGIYKITNTINNKCYIGQSVNIERRWKEHIYEGQKLHNKNKFYLALNKYGVDAFTFEVLEECPLEQKILDERERHWIEYYDSYNNGYNLTLGGQYENSWKYDPQVIRGLWDDGYSVRKIAEMVECSSQTVQIHLKGYSDYNAHTSHSRAQQHVIAEDTGSGLSPIPVYQYNLNGQYIAEYKSIGEAARKMGYDNSSTISNALNHVRQTAYGYQWSKEKVESMPMIPTGRGKLIRCINTNQIFHSAKEAAEWCGLKDGNNIGRCCKDERKTAGKHPQTGEPLKWEYVE